MVMSIDEHCHLAIQPTVETFNWHHVGLVSACGYRFNVPTLVEGLKAGVDELSAIVTDDAVRATMYAKYVAEYCVGYRAGIFLREWYQDHIA